MGNCCGKPKQGERAPLLASNSGDDVRVSRDEPRVRKVTKEEAPIQAKEKEKEILKKETEILKKEEAQIKKEENEIQKQEQELLKEELEFRKQVSKFASSSVPNITIFPDLLVDEDDKQLSAKVERELKRRNTDRKVNKERVQFVDKEKSFNNFSVLKYENVTQDSSRRKSATTSFMDETKSIGELKKMASDLTLDQIRLSGELAKRLSGGSLDPLSNLSPKTSEQVSDQTQKINISAEQLEKELSNGTHASVVDIISDQPKSIPIETLQEISKESSSTEQLSQEKKEEISSTTSNESSAANTSSNVSTKETETNAKMMECKVVKVIYAFKSRAERELTLNANDEIAIIETDTGGWWKGLNLESKEMGWFPGNYVKETGKTTQIPAIPTEAELKAILEKEEQEEEELVEEEEEPTKEEMSESAPLTQPKMEKKKEKKAARKLKLATKTSLKIQEAQEKLRESGKSALFS